MKQLSKYQMAILYVLMNNNYLTTHQVHSRVLDVDPLNGGCLGHLNRASSNLIALKKRGYVRKIKTAKDKDHKWSITAVGQSVVKSEVRPAKVAEALKRAEEDLKFMSDKYRVLEQKMETLLTAHGELKEEVDLLRNMTASTNTTNTLRREIEALKGRFDELFAFSKSHVHASDTAQLIINAKKAGAHNITIEL